MKNTKKYNVIKTIVVLLIGATVWWVVLLPLLEVNDWFNLLAELIKSFVTSWVITYWLCNKIYNWFNK